MLLSTLLLFVGVVSSLGHGERKQYDGYKVLSIYPQDGTALNLLRSLMLKDEIDFWQEPTAVGKEVHVMLSPSLRPAIEEMLRNAGISFTYHIENLQDQLTPMWDEIDARQRNPEKMAFDLDDFNTLDDINAWLEELVGSCRPGFTCELYSIGNSYEGRPINVFKISKPDAGRKAFWIDATIHAREWIATSTGLKILNNFVTGGDEDAIRFTEQYDWYILPVVNPDGYLYTWTNDRMWRKNRRENSGSACYGVDLNRNFEFRWGNEGVSFSPCSETYCGSEHTSEPEAQVVSAEVKRVASTLGAFLSLHSYGQMWMFPWGNTIDYAGVTCQRADDHEDLYAVASAAADAIQATYGTTWSRGNSCEVIYATTGSSVTFAKGTAGIKYTFTTELRGNSFVIDKSNIPLAYNEIWNGVVAMVNTINA